MSSKLQPSFSSGELSPALYARVDLERYYTGLRALRNFFVLPHGGVSNRPGTQFVAEVKDSSRAVRLIPWIFSDSQTYVLEFGHLYMRVFRDGAQVLDPGTGLPAEIVTPYVEDDLFGLHYAQSGDVMTLAHKNYPPKQLTRTDHHLWTLADDVFTPDLAAPTGVTLTAETTTGDTREWEYKVTAVTIAGVESLGSTTATVTAVLTSSDAITVAWSAVTGADYYNIYRGRDGYLGFIGSSKTTDFVDLDFPALYGEVPPEGKNPFAAAGDYPATVTYFQQRKVFGATDNEPAGIWMSRSGVYRSFDAAIPPGDSDSITIAIASQQVNSIRALVPLRVLMALTTSAEWSVTGGDSTVVTPTSINVRVEGYRGSAELAPLLVDNSAVYLQEQGAAVRDLQYSLEVDGYVGNDLSVLSEHLLRHHLITDWAWARVPHFIAWCVRDDGTALSLTYMREHQVTGWARHDTDGLFESVAAVPGDLEHAVYFVVNRTIDGQTKRYVERLNSRRFTAIEDAVFLDSALSFDGWNSGATTMTAANGVTWASDEELDMNASANTFASTDVGDFVRLVGADEAWYDFEILSITNQKSARVRAVRDVPADLQAQATTNWAFARIRLRNLDHLEGESVGVLVDGNVHAPVTVTGGTFELSTPGAKIHAGLAYVSDLETLDLVIPGAPATLGKRKGVGRVVAHVRESRGLWAGPDATHLREYTQRRVADAYDAVPLLTGRAEVLIPSSWTETGRVFIRQSDPLPLTLLAIDAEITIGR